MTGSLSGPISSRWTFVSAAASLRPPTAKHQIAAALAQGPAQVREALQHELRAWSRRMTPVEQPVVEAEERDHAVGLRERGVQRGMVVNA